MNYDDIPKDLRFMLAQRGGLERIRKVLEARRATKDGHSVYSTEAADAARRDADKNKGCIPSSAGIRSHDVFHNFSTGGTHYLQLSDSNKILRDRPFARVLGERRIYR